LNYADDKFEYLGVIICQVLSRIILLQGPYKLVLAKY